MLLGLAGLLVVLWLLGLVFHLFGGFIHFILIVAILVAVLHWLTNGK